MILIVMYSSLLIVILIILVRESVEAWRGYRFDRDQRLWQIEREQERARKAVHEKENG